MTWSLCWQIPLILALVAAGAGGALLTVRILAGHPATTLGVACGVLALIVIGADWWGWFAGTPLIVYSAVLVGYVMTGAVQAGQSPPGRHRRRKEHQR